MLSSSRPVFFLRRSPLRRLRELPAEAFERYVEIENTNANRLHAVKESGLYHDEWIATEKVHGANFGIYSLHGGRTTCFAKRSGIMPPYEHFFGYHVLLPDLQRYAAAVRGLLSQKLGLSPSAVLINGELFGGKYDHPNVQRVRKTVMVGGRPRAVSAVQTDSFPQYSPNLHFYAFDVKYREADAQEEGGRGGKDYRTLTHDDASGIFEQVPGLLYARPIIRGPLSKILAFDVERFQTTIPALVGMGNFPLKGNWAEGLVVKHSKRGLAGFDPKVLTILKLKCTAFQEISIDPREGPRVDVMEGARESAIALTGVQLPALESVVQDEALLTASRQLLRHICPNRLNNVLSKIGTDPLESGAMRPEDLATLLAKDALKDFLKEASPKVLMAPIITRRDMTKYVLFEARKLVHSSWKDILSR